MDFNPANQQLLRWYGKCYHFLNDTWTWYRHKYVEDVEVEDTIKKSVSIDNELICLSLLYVHSVSNYLNKSYVSLERFRFSLR